MENLASLWHSLPDASVVVAYGWRLIQSDVFRWVFGGTIATAVPLAWKYRVWVEKQTVWFQSYYEVPGPRVTLGKEAIQPRTRRFHGFAGKASAGLSRVQLAAAGIPVRRVLLDDIMLRIRSSAPYLHIHVTAGRNEGKTTLLTMIAMEIAAADQMLVACHRESDESHQDGWRGLDVRQLLAHWRRSPLSWLTRRRAPHLLVILDEISPLDGGRPSPDDHQRFFQPLRDAARARHRIRLVTAANHELDPATDKLELTLAAGEERAFVEHLWKGGVIKWVHSTAKEAKAVSSYAGLIDEIGGRRAYKNSLKAFLAAVFSEVTKEGTGVLRFDDLLGDSAEELRRTLVVVAACQMLDIEVPLSLIGELQPLTSDKLSELTRAWVRPRPLSFVSVQQDGAALTAPHLATQFLTLLGVSTVEALTHEYRRVFECVLRQPDTEVHREFLRHILYRLAKERVPLLHSQSGEVAVQLFKEYADQLFERVSSLRTVNELAAWFVTLVRLNQPEAREFQQRAFVALRRGDVATGAAITQLATGCAKLEIQLTEDEFQLLDAERVLRPDSPLREKDSRRQNEVLTTYCGLLARAGRQTEALRLFERAGAWMEMDSLSMISWANTQAQVSPETAAPLYQTALNSAKANIETNPDAVAAAYIALGRFCEKYLKDPRQALHHLESAAQHAANSPRRLSQISSMMRQLRRSLPPAV